MNRVLALLAVIGFTIAIIIYDDGKDVVDPPITFYNEGYIERAGLCSLYYFRSNQSKASDLALLEASWWIEKNKSPPLNIDDLNKTVNIDITALIASQQPQPGIYEAINELIENSRCYEIVESATHKIAKNERLLEIFLKE